MNRHCGNCTLCCKLVPVRELDKPANTRCQFQRHVGCAIYHKRPHSCRLWNCGWLAGAELRRPDRTHYVVDVMPDFIEIRNNETGETMKVPCMQVWVDPRFPDAHRDPDLRRMLTDERVVAVIRNGSHDGFVLFPPTLSADGEWHEQAAQSAGQEHTREEVANVIHGVNS